MKTEKEDRNLEDLFRNKLEYAEIIPDASVNTILMRRLAGREFVRFNPARFNIWYLGGIVAAGIAAALIISSGQDNTEKSVSATLSKELNKTVLVENTNTQTENISVQTTENSGKTSAKEIKIVPVAGTRKVPEKKPSDVILSREAATGTINGVDDSFSNKALFPKAAAEQNKLQGGIKTNKLQFETSGTEGCVPFRIEFYSNSEPTDSSRWTFGDGGYSNEKNPVWIFDVEGEYKIVLQLFGKDGLKSASSVVVIVHPKPQARFEFAPEKAVLPKDEIRFYNYSADAVRYKWEFGDGYSSELFEPRHRYTNFGNFNVRLVASSAYGCSDSITVMNAFSDSEYFINFPNAFIPNSDGPTGGYYSSKSDEAAQVFHPTCSGVSEYHLKIFSKLGILIFESSDVNIGWDGYFKGQPVEAGVYIWKVRGNFRNGEPFTKMGDLTLLKY